MRVCLETGVLILAGVTLVWGLSLRLRDASVMDAAWGLGFVFAAWYAQLRAGIAIDLRHALMLGAVSLWGLRLSGYLGWRRWGQPEDKRYRRWREQAGRGWWWKSYIKVFILQGLLIWVISAPLLALQC